MKPKIYSVLEPGDKVQIDTLDIHPFPGAHFKHFSARDVIYRWDVIEVYPKASSRQARLFLQTLLQRLPFKPKALQVYGGSEFMAEFDQACADLKIKLFVLSPRSPKLNGRVERLIEPIWMNSMLFTRLKATSINSTRNWRSGSGSIIFSAPTGLWTIWPPGSLLNAIILTWSQIRLICI